eukprot:11049760-Alexandrium_andersonii.AAC.1
MGPSSHACCSEFPIRSKLERSCDSGFPRSACGGPLVDSNDAAATRATIIDDVSPCQISAGGSEGASPRQISSGDVCGPHITRWCFTASNII